MEESVFLHKAGDFVSYKQNGICKIKGIFKGEFAFLGEKQYYELSPIYDPKTVIFVPLDSPELLSGMQHILSKDEIDSIIKESESKESLWIDDQKERAKAFQNILMGKDRAKILWIVKNLSLYKIKLEEEKKKLYASDARILEAAQKAITEEFAFVLGIKREEVVPYIIEKLNN